MGIDACIYVKTKDGQAPDLCDQLPNGFRVLEAGQWAPEGATHDKIPIGNPPRSAHH